MVIQRCYENWSGWVKTHSDGLNAAWNLFPAPNHPPICAAQKCKQISTVLSWVSHTLFHPRCLLSFAPRLSAWLPLWKIHYFFPASSLLIGICLKFEHSDTVPISCVNCSRTHRKIYIFHHKDWTKTDFQNRTKEAAASHAVPNILYIHCIYSQLPFASPLLSHPTKLPHIESSQHKLCRKQTFLTSI